MTVAVIVVGVPLQFAVGAQATATLVILVAIRGIAHERSGLALAPEQDVRDEHVVDDVRGVAPTELVLFQLKRTTAVGVPETGGLGSGHEAVSESEVSGPLELRASLMMYEAANRASSVRSRLSFTDVLLFITRMNALPRPPTISASITITMRSSTIVKPASSRADRGRASLVAPRLHAGGSPEGGVVVEDHGDAQQRLGVGTRRAHRAGHTESTTRRCIAELDCGKQSTRTGRAGLLIVHDGVNPPLRQLPAYPSVVPTRIVAIAACIADVTS